MDVCLVPTADPLPHACGGPEGGEGGKTPPDPSDSGTLSGAPSAELSADTLGGTYWTAVQHESYDDLYDRTNVSQMPTDKWWADLFLNEDRTTQFREVLGDTFNLYLTDGLWSLEADGTLHLTDAGGNRDYDMAGRFEEGRLILETAYGDTSIWKRRSGQGPAVSCVRQIWPGHGE